MKKTKRYLALMTASFLAITPMAATGLTAVAEDTTYTITVTPSKEGTHNYKAYQVFKGELSGTGTSSDPYVLTEIEWGDNINPSAFLTALKSADVFKTVDDDDDSQTPNVSIFKDATEAADVAAILEGYADDSDFAIAFAKFAGEKLTGTAKATDESSTYQLSGLAAGYYIVKDEATITATNPRTLNLLKVAGDVTITTKEDLPTLNKVIVGGADSGKAKTARVGDIVDYQITSAIPDMTGYDKHFFIINDTLESGLTFNESTVSVSIGNST